MKKSNYALLFLCLLMILMLPTSVKAEDTKQKYEGGTWVLVDAIDYNPEEVQKAIDEVGFTGEGEYEGEYLTYAHDFSRGRIADSYSFHYISFLPTPETGKCNTVVSWTEPPAVIEVGQESKASFTFHMETNPSGGNVNISGYRFTSLMAKAYGVYHYASSEDDKSWGYVFRELVTEKDLFYLDSNSSQAETLDTTVYCESDSVRENWEKGDRFIIYVRGGLNYQKGGVGENVSGTDYIYEYNPGTAVVATGAVPGDTASTPSDNTENSIANVVINTNASSTSGETGASVPAIIAIGLASAVAAVGAASLAGTAGAGDSSGDSESQEEQSKSTFKMYLHKEFGNAIKYDAPAVIVYARMIEITAEGEERDRTDLTQQISIFSTDSHMKVGNPSQAGDYVGATIEAETVKGASMPTEGIVSFKFIGEGGSFQNNVKFRLTGEPYIKFDEQGDHLFVTVNMIAGDEAQYIVPFTLVDFTRVPKLSLKPQEESPFAFKFEKMDEFSYQLILDNQSVSSEKTKVQSKAFRIEVIAKSEVEYQSNSFHAVLYPEGLTVSMIKFNNNGYAQIGAYSDKEATESSEAVLATSFKVELAVSGIDVKGRRKVDLVDVSKTEVIFDGLRSSDTATENLAKAFQYEIEDTKKLGIYKFQPKMQIPEGRSNYYLLLPISSEYENKRYNLDLPVRLIGEPFNEMKAKKEEFDLLLKRIQRYIPPEDWSGIIRSIKENYDHMSPKEIRLLNRSLFEITRDKLLNEAQANINYAETLDWVIGGLEWVKWIGDQAFSYAVLSLGGPAGPLAEALLSPTKEIMLTLIGENIWYREGISSPDAKLKGVNSNLMTMLENSLMTQIGSETNIKKAGAILASFTVVKIVNHYYNDVGSDGKPIGFYDAILAGLGDLTVNSFKFIVSNKFDQLAKSPKAKEYFEEYSGDWIKRFLDTNAAGWRDKGLEVIKKYVEELCGLSAAKVYKKASQVGFETKPGDLIININLWEDSNDVNNSIVVSLDVMKIKDQLYDYIFRSMFNHFPFASTLLNPPTDPMYVA